MEPFTHAFTSLALARTGGRRLPRFGATMLVVAGVAPDLDYASYLGGPFAFLRFHRTALHSIAGAIAMSAVLAALFCVLDRKIPQSKAAQSRTFPPLAFLPAFAICAIGAAGHLLLDLASGVGVQLLWPFRIHWFGWDLATNLDPWVLLILIAGLLLPMLFRMINEEVGERKKGPGGGSAAVFTLVLLAIYFGARAHFHGEAVNLVLSSEYHGRVALSGDAFPESSTLFDWRGVAVTDNTIEEIDVPLGANADFDPDRSVTHYKPEDSRALLIGEKTAATARFEAYARIPFATVEHHEADYRFEIHDLRFAPDDTDPANIFLREELNSDLQITRWRFLFASSPNP